jgi:hypothetical protein
VLSDGAALAIKLNSGESRQISGNVPNQSHCFSATGGYCPYNTECKASSTGFVARDNGGCVNILIDESGLRSCDSRGYIGRDSNSLIQFGFWVDNACWSPDGQFLAFTEGLGDYNISVASVDGNVVNSVPGQSLLGGGWTQDGNLFFWDRDGRRLSTYTTSSGEITVFPSITKPENLSRVVWP